MKDFEIGWRRFVIRLISVLGGRIGKVNNREFVRREYRYYYLNLGSKINFK